jgi:hypothetical protein
MTNYRPTALLSNFSKALEKVMYSRLSHHMLTNNITAPEQFGFWSHISIENAAFRLTNSMFKSINQKMHIGGILCNLVKAFDCANHEILLTKLHFYSMQ